jgi:hypothetical protein
MLVLPQAMQCFLSHVILDGMRPVSVMGHHQKTKKFQRSSRKSAPAKTLYSLPRALSSLQDDGPSSFSGSWADDRMAGAALRMNHDELILLTIANPFSIFSGNHFNPFCLVRQEGML